MNDTTKDAARFWEPGKPSAANMLAFRHLDPVEFETAMKAAEEWSMLSQILARLSDGGRGPVVTVCIGSSAKTVYLDSTMVEMPANDLEQFGRAIHAAACRRMKTLRDLLGQLGISTPEVMLDYPGDIPF